MADGNEAQGVFKGRRKFLTLLRQSLEVIREPRFFVTERGYQGELLAQLSRRLEHAAFPGQPIVEQEYQKTLDAHGITIRPDLIIHIPFERHKTQRRDEGNFVAIEIKLRATRPEALGDFESLKQMVEELNYPLVVFLNIDSDDTHGDSCPRSIVAQTVCIAVRLKNGEPFVRLQECARRGNVIGTWLASHIHK